MQNEKLGFILTRKFRSAVAERQNNAVRTELLKALVKQSVDLFIHTMESKRGEGRKSAIDAISKEDGDVSEILFSLDSKIVEAPDCLGRDCPNVV